jgi:carbonic anhydrase
VQAALDSKHYGVVDNWIRGIRDNYYSQRASFTNLSDQEKSDLMCELNVITQVKNLSHSRIVQSAWEKGRKLSIHGWIYRLSTGLIQDLDVSHHKSTDIESIYRAVPQVYK